MMLETILFNVRDRSDLWWFPTNEVALSTKEGLVRNVTHCSYTTAFDAGMRIFDWTEYMEVYFAEST